MSERGYCGIGIYGTKTAANVGTLWRSAGNMGAAFIFTVGRRFPRQAADTIKAWKHIPYLEAWGPIIAKDDEVEVMPVEEHEAAMGNARHERDFWSWKCARRDAALEEWGAFKDSLLSGELREKAAQHWANAVDLVEGPTESDRNLVAEFFQIALNATPEIQPQPTQPNPIGDPEEDEWRLSSEPAPTKCGMCGGPFPHKAGDREQLQELLEAVDEHRSKREQHPKGPSKRNEKLWATADRIRADQKAGS